MESIDRKRVFFLFSSILAAALAIFLLLSLSSATSTVAIGSIQADSLLSLSTEAATCTVTGTADSGPGTLRQCLLDAQPDDSITFDPTIFPPSNPVTITLFNPLPEIITDGLTIDGNGVNVILDGHVLTGAHGLRVRADNVTIRYLQIVNFGWSGFRIYSDSISTTIEGNTVGGNRNDGIRIEGISITNTRILNNVISGNSFHGIRVEGSSISSTYILGNYLGTDASGTMANGNGFSGISIKDGPSSTLVQGNVIAANDDHGITISGPSTGNIVISNSIGTDISGSLNLGNNLNGIIIRDGAQDNIVGPGNRIAYNGWDGICVTGTATLRNTITRNSITANNDLGIDNVNGGNAEIAPPTIITVTDRTIQGRAQPGATIELFTDPFFEGQRFIVSATADLNGIFTATLTTSLTEPLLTATSTDVAGNTSQFTASCRLEGLGSPDIIWPYCTTGPSLISSPFGPRQMASEGFRYDFHRGVDLPAPLETPFFAIAEGTVTEVDPSGPDGTIQIQHSGPVTYCSRYRHVLQSLVITGQEVYTGTLIGLTGQSSSRFEHLHFEIRDEPCKFEKYSVNPFKRMPHISTDDYEIEISQVSVDPTNPASPTTVWVKVTGPRQELDLNWFTVSVGGSERVLNLNNLNLTKTPAPNNTVPDILDNPYQDGICIMPSRFNTSSDAYRLNLVFNQMPGHPPHTVTAQAADFSSNAVTTTLFASGGLLLTPPVVTATTPTGRWVTHTHTLTNAGTTTRVYALTARSAQSWNVIVEPGTVTLASGESVTFTTSISVPANRYVVTDTIDCVVVEISSTAIYLSLVLKNSSANRHEYHVQGCLDSTTPTDDQVEIYVEGNDIVMQHYNAVYNCCAAIVVDLVDEHPLLKLVERETYPGGVPCTCTCPYDISARIPNLPSGNYRVEVWNGDQSHRYGWAEVVVP